MRPELSTSILRLFAVTIGFTAGIIAAAVIVHALLFTPSDDLGAPARMVAALVLPAGALVFYMASPVLGRLVSLGIRSV